MSIIAAVLALAAQGASSAGNDVPASPFKRLPPAYPVTCLASPGDPSEPPRVVVAFGLNEAGHPENVRAVESSDPCFEEAAIAAVRGWQYKPRRVNGVPHNQEGLETSFTFVLEEPAEVADSDAVPVFRQPPEYPFRCASKAEQRESLYVEFDVTPEGRTHNVRTVESTNACFNEAAESAVALWRYLPKFESGRPVERKGVLTSIAFELAGGRLDVRPAVSRKLFQTEKALRRRNADPAAALAALGSLEAKFGASF